MVPLGPYETVAVVVMAVAVVTVLVAVLMWFKNRG